MALVEARQEVHLGRVVRIVNPVPHLRDKVEWNLSTYGSQANHPRLWKFSYVDIDTQ
jgi:hypothetical protein